MRLEQVMGGCGYELATWGILQRWRHSISWLYQCQYPGCDCTPQFCKMLSFFKLGCSCFTYSLLVSAVQGSESAMCIHISLLGPPSQPFRSSQSTELSSLGFTVTSHYSRFHILQGRHRDVTVEGNCCKDYLGPLGIISYNCMWTYSYFKLALILKYVLSR